MVFGIVNQHGGVTEVSRQPAKGSGFRIRFPENVPAESPQGENRS